MTLVLIIRIQVRQSNPPQISLYLSKFILIALRTLKNFTFLLMGDLCLKLFFSNEIQIDVAHPFRLMLPCAVERHFPMVGANPTQHLSLRLVATLTYYGGNDVK